MTDEPAGVEDADRGPAGIDPGEADPGPAGRDAAGRWSADQDRDDWRHAEAGSAGRREAAHRDQDELAGSGDRPAAPAGEDAAGRWFRPSVSPTAARPGRPANPANPANPVDPVDPVDPVFSGSRTGPTPVPPVPAPPASPPAFVLPGYVVSPGTSASFDPPVVDHDADLGRWETGTGRAGTPAPDTQDGGGPDTDSRESDSWDRYRRDRYTRFNTRRLSDTAGGATPAGGSPAVDPTGPTIPGLNARGLNAPGADAPGADAPGADAPGDAWRGHPAPGDLARDDTGPGAGAESVFEPATRALRFQAPVPDTSANPSAIDASQPRISDPDTSDPDTSDPDTPVFGVARAGASEPARAGATVPSAAPAPASTPVDGAGLDGAGLGRAGLDGAGLDGAPTGAQPSLAAAFSSGPRGSADPHDPAPGRPEHGRSGSGRPTASRSDPAGESPVGGLPPGTDRAGTEPPLPDAGSAEDDDGSVRDSFAELAATAYDGGDHAPEVTEIVERTLAPLLLHSLSDLREMWVPLLEASGARSVAEIGSESGVTTSLLVDLLRRSGGGRLLVIDPDPGVAPSSGGGLDVEVVRGYSPEALDGHAPTDAYLIDGDHNYATVRGELGMIDTAVRDFGRSSFPLVILHDVGWPAGRRDQYYDPDRIPESTRQPNSWDVGVEIDKKDAIPGRGFRGMGAFSWALTEGGPRNGVRTAVEDFVADHPDLRFFTVAPIFGLGVIVDRRAPWARRIADLLAPWVSNTLLARMERNRIDLYLRVLALQDDAVAAARSRQREWARMDAERSEHAARDLQRLHRISELEQELAAARRVPRPPWVPASPDESRFVTAARIANSALRSRLGAGSDTGGSAGSGSAGSGSGARAGGTVAARVSANLARRGDAIAARSNLPALRRASSRRDRDDSHSG